jgi:hypothetical protein
MEASVSESNYFRALLDMVPIATYCTNATGYLTYFNQAAADFSGRIPRLGVDRWCVTWKLFHCDGSPMPHDECPMAIALKEERVVFGEYALAERPDGTRVRFTPYPMPFHGPDGKLVGGINMLVNPAEYADDNPCSTLLSCIAGSPEGRSGRENPASLIHHAFAEMPKQHFCAGCGLVIEKDERPTVEFHEDCYQKVRSSPEADAWTAFNQLNQSLPGNSAAAKKRKKTKDRYM